MSAGLPATDGSEDAATAARSASDLAVRAAEGPVLVCPLPTEARTSTGGERTGDVLPL